MGRVIRPSHRCFDDAIEILEWAVKDDFLWADEHLRLVHGLCLAPEGPQAGQPFSHGWVEQDRSLVIQAGLIDGVRGYYACARRDFYKLLRVQLTTVYTIEQVWEKNRETHTYGPWESTYRALCNQSHAVFVDIE